MSINLNKSPVVFNEEYHRYYLDGKRLMGVTGLIHEILRLGVYQEKDTNEYVRDYVIPRAGSRGTAVHHAIQTYDQIGIRQPTQIVHTRYGCRERDNINYIDETWEVCNQLEAYIRHLKGFKPIDNEYTVSDNERYVSQIDNVWLKESTQGIWLIDTKTNNLDYYPLCGYGYDKFFATSEDALKEYLSWQLSIYAFLFEKQNPHLKVEGLACNWLRDNDDAFWEIKRQPDEQVSELLKTEYFFSLSEDTVYVPRHIAGLTDNITTPIKKEASLQLFTQDVIDLVYSIQKQFEEADAKLKEMKPLLRKAMEENGIKTWDSGLFKATIVKDSMTTCFDSSRFKKDYPDLYDQYLIQKPRVGGFSIKL